MARKKIDRKDKKCHREFVWLAESEYAHLCELIGKDQTERWIEELNLYIGSKGDPYESHYYAIQVWAKRAATKKTSATEIKGFGSEARRAADRVIDALRDVTKRLMPDFNDDRTKAAVISLLKTRRTTWPLLHDECREEPDAVSVFREEFLKEYK